METRETRNRKKEECSMTDERRKNEGRLPHKPTSEIRRRILAGEVTGNIGSPSMIPSSEAHDRDDISWLQPGKVVYIPHIVVPQRDRPSRTFVLHGHLFLVIDARERKNHNIELLQIDGLHAGRFPSPSDFASAVREVENDSEKYVIYPDVIESGSLKMASYVSTGMVILLSGDDFISAGNTIREAAVIHPFDLDRIMRKMRNRGRADTFLFDYGHNRRTYGTRTMRHASFRKKREKERKSKAKSDSGRCRRRDRP